MGINGLLTLARNAITPLAESRAATLGAEAQANKEKIGLALQQAQLERQRQQQSIDEALKAAQTTHLGAQTAALAHPPTKPGEFDILDTDQGFVRVPKAGDMGPIMGPGGLPLKKGSAPKAPGNIDPLSAAGIQAAADRAAAVAKAEAPYKKDPNTVTAQKPTEFNNKAALLYPRAQEAAQRLDRFYDQGASPKSAASRVPIVGNYLLSGDEQEMNQAAETVASAILRLESGAAISESEIKSYAKQFLPQPGDSPQVRQDKKRTLATQLERIGMAAEPAMGGSATTAPQPATTAPTGRGRGGAAVQSGAQPSTGTTKQKITADQAAFLREKKGMTDAEIQQRYDIAPSGAAAPTSAGRSLPRSKP